MRAALLIRAPTDGEALWDDLDPTLPRQKQILSSEIAKTIPLRPSGSLRRS